VKNFGYWYKNKPTSIKIASHVALNDELSLKNMSLDLLRFNSFTSKVFCFYDVLQYFDRCILTITCGLGRYQVYLSALNVI
jgi:hypothetical protein